MKGSSGTSNNGNGAQSQKLQVPASRACQEVEKRRKELAKKLRQGKDDSNAIWNVLSGKKTVLCRLQDEQNIVTNKFGEYRLWRNGNYSVSENSESFHRFTEIDEQTQILRRMLVEYEEKLIRALKILRDLIGSMISHCQSLLSCSEVVSQAHTLSDLAEVQIPNLERFEAIPDLEIETLAGAWEEMQLDVGISHCLRLLRMLLLQPEE